MRFAVTVLLLSLLPAAWAEDWYVSDDMQYGRGLVSDAHCTNDLPYAVSKAAGGSTVWVKDGFVCESGDGVAYGTWGLCRLIVPNSVIVRSESGYVDEAAGKGATIRGRLDEEAGAEKYYRGSNSMRCAGFNGASGSARLIGFILEKGSSNVQSDDQGGGGAVVGQARSQYLSNCVVRTSYAARGGGVRGISLYHCVVSNCTSTGQGGGANISSAYDSLFTHNCAKSNGGGAGKSCFFSNCVARLNSCTGNGGAFCNGTAIDCIVTNNTASAWGGGCGTYYNSSNPLFFVGTARGKAIIAFNSGWRGGGTESWSLTNVVVHSNAAGGFGGGVYSGRAHECVITNNTSAENGGGVREAASVTKCFIADNSVTKSGYNGGGVASCSYVADSTLSNNVCKNVGGGASDCTTITNCYFFDNTAVSSGGGAHGSSGMRIYKSYFIGNKTTQTDSTTVGGGGVYGGTVRDSYFENNRVYGGSGGGAARRATLVSCVVTNNFAGRYGGGACDCTTMNCSFLGNLQGPNGSVGAGGGAICGGTHYNALVAYNTANNYGGGVAAATCYNCTVYSNTNLRYNGIWSRGGGFGGDDTSDKVVNCISFGNVGDEDYVKWASNSCVQVSSVADAKYVDCLNENPKFRDAAAGDFAPRNRKCRDAALAFDWMTDSADVRSKDLKGNPRIFRAAPDMGCIENYLNGAAILIR